MAETQVPKSEPLQQVTFRLPTSLHRRLKVALAYDGRTMQEILNGLIEAWVRKQEDQER
jgi:predicted DNA-binding protein